MAVSFSCITYSSMPQAELFDLSRSIDAHQASMAQSREEAIAGTTSGLISLGEEVSWRARHFGVPLRMTNKITQMQEGESFTDEQIRGPFKHFRHVHEFSSHADTTTMVDHVHFAAPFGPLGRLVERLVLANYMRRLIEERNRFLTESTAKQP